jgi:hypothetical protein
VSYYISLLIFAAVAYLLVADNSIATAFDYVLKLISIDFEKKKWWFLNNPRNPVVKYLIWRRSIKLAQELMNEHNEYKNK